MEKNSEWRCPEHGEDDWNWREWEMPWEEVYQELRCAAEMNIDYAKQNAPLILGFPGTTPLPETIEVMRYFLRLHSNNIGYHTGGGEEMGFSGTQLLERCYVWAMSHLLGSANPKTEIDGYVCHGGTDGNDHGIWLGRNKLWKDHQVARGKRGIVLLTSIFGHYSFDKQFHRLLAQEDSWKGCPNSDSNLFQELPTNEAGELEAKAVEEGIRRFHADGYRRFILCLTAGTTNLGSVDQVEAICNRLAELQLELSGDERIGIHVHVDAAFGGYILPFLEPDCKFAFHNPLVGSVCLDPHKMGLVPYSAGLFLCRKGDLEYTRTEARYVRGHDHTVIGSRSGAIVAACWAAMRVLGKEGYTEKARYCLRMRDYLKQQLQTLNNSKGRVRFYPSRLNVLAVRFSEDVVQVLTEGGPNSLRRQHRIPDDLFPENLTKPTWQGSFAVRNVRIFRFVAMPHYTESGVDKFVDNLAVKLAS